MLAQHPHFCFFHFPFCMMKSKVRVLIQFVTIEKKADGEEIRWLEGVKMVGRNVQVLGQHLHLERDKRKKNKPTRHICHMRAESRRKN